MVRASAQYHCTTADTAVAPAPDPAAPAAPAMVVAAIRPEFASALALAFAGSVDQAQHPGF